MKISIGMMLLLTILLFNFGCGHDDAQSGVSGWPTGSSHGSPPQSGEALTPQGVSSCSANTIQTAFDLINGVRSAQHIAALIPNNHLMVAAERRSLDMATNQQLSHNGWNVTIGATGYASSVIGENIASGYRTAPAVVQGWVESPGHYANIVTSNYKEAGMGCVIDPSGTYWWTQDFGAP